MRLIPYLHAAFHRYAEEGIPPFRPLFMDYPDELESRKIDDQILIGDRLLAAPVIGGASSRSIWLPPGEWIDFWTGEHYPGKRTVEFPSDTMKLPLFVKNHSILPLAIPTLHTNDPASFGLEIRVYGDGALPALLLEGDDGDLPYDETRVSLLELAWDAAQKRITSRRTRADHGNLYRVEQVVEVPGTS